MRRVVLKPDGPPEASAGGLRLEMRDFARQARHAVVAAEAKAQQVLQEAQRRVVEMHRAAEDQQRLTVEQGRVAGHEQGYQEGYAAGQSAARQDMTERFERESRTAAEALRAAAEQLQRGREQWLAEANRDVLVIALSVAQRVVERLGETEPGAAAESARKALEAIRGAHDVVLRMHPADHELLNQCATATLQNAVSTASVRFVADEHVPRGGAWAETAQGVVDAGLLTQVSRIGDELLASWRRRQAELMSAGKLDAAEDDRGARP